MGLHRKVSGGSDGGYRRAYYPSGPWINPPGRPPNYTSTAPAKPEAPNPDPTNYKIVKAQEEGKYLILKINYPDCTNFEGNKILVFHGAKLLDIVNQKVIDPHFFQDKKKKYVSPIARFVPTDEGWEMAVKFAIMMSGR